MEDSRIKISVGLPWLSVAIGIVSGWLVIGGVEGMILGFGLGIIISFASYLGAIPFVGWWVYGWVANYIFGEIGHSMPLLFWWGMICAVIFCIITSIFAGIGILAFIGGLLE